MNAQAIQQALHLIHQGKLKKAEQLLSQPALSKQPDALFLRGFIQFQQQSFKESITLFEKALALDGQNAEYLAHLGWAKFHAGFLGEGLKIMEEARKLDPHNLNSHFYMGKALLQLNMLKEAIGLFNKVMELDRYNLEAWFGKINALILLGQLDQASQELEKAGPLAENLPITYVTYARLFIEQGNLEAAEEACKAALKLAPNHLEALRIMGRAYDQWGKPKQAQQYFRKVLQQNPNDLNIIYRMLRMGAPESAQLAHRLKFILENNPDLPPQTRKSLLFNLGVAEEKKQRYRKSMEYFLEAGKYHHQDAEHEKTNAFFERIRQVFSAENLQRLGSLSQCEAAPIFIVGLPRSGSTLTESMLATHPDVHEIGESSLLSQLASNSSHLFDGDTEYPEWVDELEDKKWTGLAQYYLLKAELNAPHPGMRTVDKNLSNFYQIGFIRALFPNARVLHCHRNPLDVATSCLSIDFAGYFPWTYSMEDFIAYYRMYEEMMAHWKAVLPGFVMDLQYEDMVNKPEETSRAVFDFVGLEWSEDVLSFNRRKRRVATASVNQVRKGIYTSSQQRWKRYGDLIQPLIDAFPEWANQ